MKEEIKAFLNNRRISQAIVGQVTGTHELLEEELASKVWATREKNVAVRITQGWRKGKIKLY